MNAFFIFCKRHRDVVREKYPHLENRSITKILGEWWANLDASEKSTYTALAKQYKEAFMKAHPDFKWYKLPTVPTRTLVTRPSNTRCSQAMKKEKALSKSSCGIALGKLADDEQLGGLSSLLVTNSTEPSVSSGDSQEPSSSPVTSTSSNLLKPPKKRYLVNGEFMCKLDTTPYDDQTQNACSALLELAEICANTASHSLPSSKTLEVTDSHCAYGTVTSYTSANCYKSLPLKSHPANTISPSECDPLLLPTPSSSYIKPPECPPVYIPHDAEHGMPYLQEQPLNLCKQKGKTFTTSNQQIIDHLVDKFLCEPPPLPVKSPLNLQVADYSLNKLPSPSSSKVSCQSFTLSAAIESAIDQAYSKSVTEPLKRESLELVIPHSAAEYKTAAGTSTKRHSPSTVTNSNATNNGTVESEETEVVFIDKIKKACLASSWKSSEKTVLNRYSPRTLASSIPVSQPIIKLESKIPAEATPKSTDPLQEESCSSNAVPSKSETKFSSSKYYSKFVSPPKKSQVWCRLFMKEQLENSDSDGSLDTKKAVMDSPVRRNSQRTCKGRRYQALITEGLLQSTKERKAAAGKKPFPAPEKCRIKSSSVSDIPPVILKPKRKKRDAFGKSKSLEKEEEEEYDDDSDIDKGGIFDLNEKIASLPKCSMETLNKKRKLSASTSSTNPKSGSNSQGAEAKKASKESANTRQADEGAPKTRQEESTSTGRFKTGNFDLEQHIASLPKCDIEILNKRRNKKD